VATVTEEPNVELSVETSYPDWAVAVMEALRFVPAAVKDTPAEAVPVVVERAPERVAAERVGEPAAEVAWLAEVE
jgi:hypothetical protein